MSKPRKIDRQFNNVLGPKESNSLSSMPPGCVVDILNMYYDERGGRKTRPGYVKAFYGGSAHPIEMLYDYTNYAGTQEILFVQNGILKKYTVGGGVASVKTGLTAGITWNATTYLDRVFLAPDSGTDGYICYDGTACFNIGIIAPSAAPTTALRAGGALPAGVYQYHYTFYNSTDGWESSPYGTYADASEETSAGAPGNATVRITLEDKQSTDDRVTHYRIYRTATDGTTLYRVAELVYATYAPTGGTGYYDDAGDDDGSLALVYDNDPPAAGGTRFVEFLDRLYLLINDADYGPILAYSKNSLRPYAWPIDNFTPVPADGSLAYWHSRYRNSLAVYSGHSVYLLTSDPASSGYLTKISDVGLHSTHGSCEEDTFIAYWSRNGFYAQKPTQYDPLDLRKDLIGVDIATHSADINLGAASTIRTISYKTDDFQHVFFAVPYKTSTTADYLYVFDFVSGQWTFYKLGHSVTAFGRIWENASSGERVYFGDPNGYVWKFSDPDDGCFADGYDDTPANLNGTATTGSTTAINDTGKAWTINDFVGMYVTVLSGTNVGESKLISANTATGITCAAFTGAIDATSVYSIGAYDHYTEEFWNSTEAPEALKRIRWVKSNLDQDSACSVGISVRKNMSDTSMGSKTLNLTGNKGIFPLTFPVTFANAALTFFKRIRFSGKYRYFSIKYRNQRAGDYFGLDSYSVDYQELYDRTG